MLFILALSGCSGGNDGGEATRPSATMVTIQGEVSDGTLTSPIPGATCQFVPRNGTRRAQARADSTGAFRLQVPPEMEGFMRCAPPGLAHLVLSTFVSTVGKEAGETIPETGREEVSPQTTVVAMVLARENPTNSQARKAQLLAALAAQDPALTALAEAAVVLFEQLLEARTDVIFDDTGASPEGGGDGGGDGDGDSDGDSADGGATGDVGDGAEASPIPNAVCEFVLGLGSAALVNTVLHDLFVDGRVTRPDLQSVATQVNAALAGRTTAITDAFAALFPNGIGQPLRDVAAGADTATPGRYFLPVPPHVPGFVLCHPPDRELLVLATFVPAREAGELLVGQDVNPGTTMFSVQVGIPLADNGLPVLKQNYLADVAGLRVGVTQENGNITGFHVPAPANVRDPDVGLVVFAATALYTLLLDEEVNADFVAAWSGLVGEAAVDPARLAEDPAVSTELAQAVANVVNTSTTTAGDDLDTQLDTALLTARLEVRVQAERSGAALPGATVELLDVAEPLQCVNCPAVTDANGEITLTVVGVPNDDDITVTVGASLEGFQDTTVTQQIVAIARVPVEIELSAQDDDDAE
jgi:hypothetical protein